MKFDLLYSQYAYKFQTEVVVNYSVDDNFCIIGHFICIPINVFFCVCCLGFDRKRYQKTIFFLNYAEDNFSYLHVTITPSNKSEINQEEGIQVQPFYKTERC
jgi:hypothetical protein